MIDLYQNWLKVKINYQNMADDLPEAMTAWLSQETKHGYVVEKKEESVPVPPPFNNPNSRVQVNCVAMVHYVLFRSKRDATLFKLFFADDCLP